MQNLTEGEIVDLENLDYLVLFHSISKFEVVTDMRLSRDLLVGDSAAEPVRGVGGRFIVI